MTRSKFITFLTIRMGIPAAFVYHLLALGGTASATTTIWNLYFSTGWHPCGEGVLITPGGSAGPGVRPCSYSIPTYPWDQCQPITIIGYNIVHEVTDQSSRTWMVVGSGHGGDGADVFAKTGGVGTTQHGMMFPTGAGIKQGSFGPGNPTGVHIDVYGTCLSGQQRGLVSIFYTSP